MFPRRRDRRSTGVYAGVCGRSFPFCGRPASWCSPGRRVAEFSSDRFLDRGGARLGNYCNAPVKPHGFHPAVRRRISACAPVRNRASCVALFAHPGFESFFPLTVGRVAAPKVGPSVAPSARAVYERVTSLDQRFTDVISVTPQLFSRNLRFRMWSIAFSAFAACERTVLFRAHQPGRRRNSECGRNAHGRRTADVVGRGAAYSRGRGAGSALGRQLADRLGPYR